MKNELIAKLNQFKNENAPLEKESVKDKITIPTKNGTWEWTQKGFGFRKDQKQNG